MEMRSVLELKPASYNPRKITDWELRKLMRSIETYGFVEPVVVNSDMTIIGGHQRVEAAKNLGIEMVPVVIVDLPKNKEKALNIALNRISGEFDEDRLAFLLAELDESDRMGSGFDEREILELLKRAQPEIMGDINTPDGDKPPFEQITFTLATEQAAVVREALAMAAEMEPSDPTGNLNRNGNAIAAICTAFLAR